MTPHGPSPAQRLCASREQIRLALKTSAATRQGDVGPWPAAAAAMATAAWAVTGDSGTRWPRWALAAGMAMGLGAIAWSRSRTASSSPATGPRLMAQWLAALATMSAERQGRPPWRER
jgi:hypothetical protein